MSSCNVHLTCAPLDKKKHGAQGGAGAGWYILRIVSGLDFLAEEALRESGWDVFLARERKWRPLRWRRKPTQAAVEDGYPRFPGYLFVAVTPPGWPDLTAWPFTALIRGILSMNGQPVPLAPGEVDRLRSEDGTAVPPVMSVPLHRAFVVGQRVRVLAGPFRDFVADLDAVDEGGASITVQIFGRPTPVRELPLAWLEAAA